MRYHPRPPRRTLRRAASVALGSLLLLASCGGGGGGDDDAAPSTDPEPEPVADVEVTINEVSVSSAGEKTEMPPGVVEAVRAQLDAYVQQATVNPLLGGDSADLAALFTPFAATRLEGPDRASLVDADLGPATGDVVANSAAANLTGLADGSGKIVLVAATLVLDVETETDEGPVHITRLGDLVLVPDGFDWKIDGFDLNVQREVPGDEATDTATDGAQQDGESS
ncbi:MAG: hypothetical protein M5U31_05795 [Acidimicrobiia bacterium]|nr:hypothetical protein [Acidimicrobiia bacterium]